MDIYMHCSFCYFIYFILFTTLFSPTWYIIIYNHIYINASYISREVRQEKEREKRGNFFLCFRFNGNGGLWDTYTSRTLYLLNSAFRRNLVIPYVSRGKSARNLVFLFLELQKEKKKFTKQPPVFLLAPSPLTLFFFLFFFHFFFFLHCGEMNGSWRFVGADVCSLINTHWSLWLSSGTSLDCLCINRFVYVCITFRKFSC